MSTSPRRVKTAAVYMKQREAKTDISFTLECRVGSPKYPAFLLDLDTAKYLRDMLADRIARTEAEVK